MEIALVTYMSNFIKKGEGGCRVGTGYYTKVVDWILRCGRCTWMLKQTKLLDKLLFWIKIEVKKKEKHKLNNKFGKQIHELLFHDNFNAS